jgi:hypothetical protein
MVCVSHYRFSLVQQDKRSFPEYQSRDMPSHSFVSVTTTTPVSMRSRERTSSKAVLVDSPPKWNTSQRKAQEALFNDMHLCGYASADRTILKLSSRITGVGNPSVPEIHARRECIQKLFRDGTLTFDDLYRIKVSQFDKSTNQLLPRMRFYATNDIRYDFDLRGQTRRGTRTTIKQERSTEKRVTASKRKRSEVGSTPHIPTKKRGSHESISSSASAYGDVSAPPAPKKRRGVRSYPPFPNVPLHTTSDVRVPSLNASMLTVSYGAKLLMNMGDPGAKWKASTMPITDIDHKGRYGSIAHLLNAARQVERSHKGNLKCTIRNMLNPMCTKEHHQCTSQNVTQQRTPVAEAYFRQSVPTLLQATEASRNARIMHVAFQTLSSNRPSVFHPRRDRYGQPLEALV